MSELHAAVVALCLFGPAAFILAAYAAMRARARAAEPIETTLARWRPIDVPPTGADAALRARYSLGIAQAQEAIARAKGAPPQPQPAAKALSYGDL